MRNTREFPWITKLRGLLSGAPFGFAKVPEITGIVGVGLAVHVTPGI